MIDQREATLRDLDLYARNIAEYRVDVDRWLTVYRLLCHIRGRTIRHANPGVDENVMVQLMANGAWWEAAVVLRPYDPDLEWHVVQTPNRCNAALFKGSRSIAAVDVQREHAAARADLSLTLRYHEDQLRPKSETKMDCDCHSIARQLFDYHPPCPVHEVDHD